MNNNVAGSKTAENSLLILFMGLCPVLAITTHVINAIGMGLSIIFVLLCSNFFITLLRNFIPDTIRLHTYLVIIAFFVSIVELFLEFYIPELFQSLGLFIPLIVINCIILGRIGNLNNKTKITGSIINSLGIGIGLTSIMLIIALTREILGAGTITLFPMFGFNGIIRLAQAPSGTLKVLILAPGALLITGYLYAFITWINSRKNKKSVIQDKIVAENIK